MTEFNELINIPAFCKHDLSEGKEDNEILVIDQYNFHSISPFTYVLGMETELPGLAIGKAAMTSYLNTDVDFQVFYTGCSKRGWGLQILDNIDPGKKLFEYAGDLIRDEGQQIEEDDYIIGLSHNGQNYFLDANKKGNLARFVNHSCVPNCCALIGYPNKDGFPRVLIYSLRFINAGEELVMDYGKLWWWAKIGTITCCCRCVMCRYGSENWYADDFDSSANISDFKGKTKPLTVAISPAEERPPAANQRQQLALKYGRLPMIKAAGRIRQMNALNADSSQLQSSSSTILLDTTPQIPAVAQIALRDAAYLANFLQDRDRQDADWNEVEEMNDSEDEEEDRTGEEQKAENENDDEEEEDEEEEDEMEMEELKEELEELKAEMEENGEVI